LVTPSYNGKRFVRIFAYTCISRTSVCIYLKFVSIAEYHGKKITGTNEYLELTSNPSAL